MQLSTVLNLHVILALPVQFTFFGCPKCEDSKKYTIYNACGVNVCICVCVCDGVALVATVAIGDQLDYRREGRGDGG